MYRQCLLSKGNLTQTSWIPEPFGRVGNVLKLKHRGGEWDDGWKVELASEPKEDPPDHRDLLVTCRELR